MTPPPPPVSLKQIRRSRNGCLTCRRRKVKCDELRPGCRNCELGARECVWATDPSCVKRQKILRKLAPSETARASSPTRSIPPAPSRIHSHRLLSRSETNRHVPYPAHAPNTPVHSRLQPPHLRLLPRSVSRPGSIQASAQAGPSSTRRLTTIRSSHGPGALGISLVSNAMRVRHMTEPTFLEAYFPSLDERLVIRHYISRTIHSILAFESSKQPFNPWLTVHAPLAFTHAPRACAATDALRAAMVAVGAVHLRYADDSGDEAAAWAITKAARKTVMAYLDPLLEQRDTLSHDKCEIILCALLSCLLASTLAADPGWVPFLQRFIFIVQLLGGPTRLLERADPTRLTPTRFVLEQLAVREVFGCLITGQAPVILRDPFTPWFFEVESCSATGPEWESVERAFGISRGIVDLIARASNLVSRARETDHDLSRSQPPQLPPLPVQPFQLRLPFPVPGGPNQMLFDLPITRPATKPLGRLASRFLSQRSATATSASTAASHQMNPDNDGDGDDESGSSSRDRHASELQEAANGLMAELNVWDQASNFTPLHPRTQYGNHCYRHAMRIWVLCNVYGVDVDDHRVVAGIHAIVELGKELIATYGYYNWLTWPILVAGMHVGPEDPTRAAVMGLLNHFGPHACFDNTVAVRLMEGFWKLASDDDEDVVDVWEAADRLGIRPYLD